MYRFCQSRVSIPFVGVLTLLALTLSSRAQEPDEQQPALTGAKYSNPVTNRWEVAVNITGGSAPAGNVFMTLPVPNNWPEQRVSIVKEDIPARSARVTFRDLEQGVKQLVVQMPVVQANEEVGVSIILEVETCQVDPPADTDPFVQPRSNDREARPHLGISPYANHRDGKFRRFVSELIENEPVAWKQVEILYDWVRDNIEDRDGETTPALETFEAREGTNESKVFLFIAMCRTAKFPARIVFGRGLIYAEFMLSSPDHKQNFWFPCNVNGVREFGSFAEPRIILQKGENIRVPEKEQRQKYVAEFLSCKGRAKPQVQFIRRLVENDEN